MVATIDVKDILDKNGVGDDVKKYVITVEMAVPNKKGKNIVGCLCLSSIVATIYPADKKDFRFLNSSSLSNSNRRTLSLSHGISKFD